MKIFWSYGGEFPCGFFLLDALLSTQKEISRRKYPVVYPLCLGCQRAAFSPLFPGSELLFLGEGITALLVWRSLSGFKPALWCLKLLCIKVKCPQS